MNVAMLCCHVHREIRVCDVILQTCHGCMKVAWALFWEEAVARNLLFFHVKWLQPAMNCASFAVQSSTGKGFVQAL